MLEGGYFIESVFLYVNLGIIFVFVGIDYLNIKEFDYNFERFK